MAGPSRPGPTPISLERVSVEIDRSTVLSDVTLGVPAGEFVAVVGESGSGKSTLLRAIAGLVPISTGAIHFGNRDVRTASPGERDIAMVFQEPSLMPHMSVRRNVSFPLDVRRLQVEEIRQRVDAETRALHIESLLLSEPGKLSRGEQQMVQIARALVRVPSVLLLDEPFASLDEPLRQRMRSEIAMLQEGYGVTTIMATNDSRDVARLARRVVVVDGGRIVQSEHIDQVRSAPRTLLAAAATGRLSTIDVTVDADTTGFWYVRSDPAGGPSLRLRAWMPALADYVGAAVTLGLRPEHVVVHETGAVPGIVDRAMPWDRTTVSCQVAGTTVLATVPEGVSCTAGDLVHVRVDEALVFDRRTGAAIG